MKLWRRCWMWKWLLGLVILSLHLENGLCRKRVKSKPTIPRAFNETSFTRTSSGGKNHAQYWHQPRQEPSKLTTKICWSLCEIYKTTHGLNDSKMYLLCELGIYVFSWRVSSMSFRFAAKLCKSLTISVILINF